MSPNAQFLDGSLLLKHGHKLSKSICLLQWPFPLFYGTWLSGNETSSTNQVSRCWCQIIKWLITDALKSEISIKREKCKRKIKMESVLLRGHWGSVTYICHVSLGGISPFAHPLSCSRYLSDPEPKTTSDSLRTNISWLMSVDHNSHQAS